MKADLRPDMHTKDYLAQELRKADLEDMAKKAETGYYHDFLSPLDMPELQLLQDLIEKGTPAALALADRHKDGEFDSSAAEADEWIKSAEGMGALAEIISEISSASKKDG